ncbi:26207_t:CDS:2, partial [Racocetra persica]
GFYSQDISQELNLPSFEKGDVILVTRKFQIVDYMDENYSAFALHLMRITEIIKKNLILYINGKLILYENANYVYVKSLSFPDSQKKELNLSVPLPWRSEASVEPNKSPVVKTIATRVKNLLSYCK